MSIIGRFFKRKNSSKCLINDDNRNDFEELLKAYSMYESNSCLTCNRIKYACLFKQLYNELITGELEPQGLINLQKKVFDTVLDLISERECEYFNTNNTITMFRILVTIALQIYVVGPDPYKLVAMNHDLDYDNDLFNPDEIERLFTAAELLLEKNGELYIVISDLCLGNLQFGDLLINNNGLVNGAEVKSGEKNKVISELAYKGEKNPFDPDKEKIDWKHFERVRKQWERGELILNQISAGWYLDTEKGILVFPYWLEGIENYQTEFLNALMKASEHLYNEIAIDDNITIITINRAEYHSIQHELAPPCLNILFHELKLDEPAGEDEITKVEEFYNFSDSGFLVFDYYSVIVDSNAPQPYLWGATSTTILNLYERGIELFVKIHMESLFNYLRAQGFKVYPKNRMPFKYLLEYKNKNWMIKYNNCGPEGTTAFTIDTLKRIYCGLYTSKGLADFLKLFCVALEETIKGVVNISQEI